MFDCFSLRVPQLTCVATQQLFLLSLLLLTGIKLVREQENPIQEKHRQVPRRGQHVRGEDRRQRHQRVRPRDRPRVRPRQPGQLAIDSQLSRWADGEQKNLYGLKELVHFLFIPHRARAPDFQLQNSLSLISSPPFWSPVSLTHPPPPLPRLCYWPLGLVDVNVSCLLSGWPCACH